jgi:L-fuculose-phosphate aldolase
LEKFRELIVQMGKEMCQKNLTVGTWGNISVRDAATGNIFLTPSGMDYKTCTSSDIVVFDEKGNTISGERKPSIEKDLHLSIYNKRKDVNAVVHSHPIYSSVFSVVQKSIPVITEECAQIIGEEVICAKYALPGTEELAKYAVEALGNNNAVLLSSHGAVCVGPDIEFAFKVSDVLEKTAQICILSKLIGEPRIIPKEDIIIMQDFVKNSYGQK